MLLLGHVAANRRVGGGHPQQGEDKGAWIAGGRIRSLALIKKNKKVAGLRLSACDSFV